MPGAREVFEIKPPTDTRRFYFDFAGDLAVGETITDATVTAAVWSGTDSNPSAIISGSATIDGSEVSNLITGGELGVTYRLLCTAETDEDQILTRSAYLSILREATV